MLVQFHYFRAPTGRRKTARAAPLAPKRASAPESRPDATRANVGGTGWLSAGTLVNRISNANGFDLAVRDQRELAANPDVLRCGAFVQQVVKPRSHSQARAFDVAFELEPFNILQDTDLVAQQSEAETAVGVFESLDIGDCVLVQHDRAQFALPNDSVIRIVRIMGPHDYLQLKRLRRTVNNRESVVLSILDSNGLVAYRLHSILLFCQPRRACLGTLVGFGAMSRAFGSGLADIAPC